LAAATPPTAIFASNDEMAVGVICAAQEMGVDVPGELSVAGFDDSVLASRIVPSLTTIRRPVREMARLAATKLIASLDGRQDEALVGIMLDPVLVTRNSTRAMRPSDPDRSADAPDRVIPAVRQTAAGGG
jgi:LacI family transcriptional regulator